MSHYRFNLLKFFLLSLLLTGITFSQESINIDSLRLFRYAHSLSEFTKATPESHYRDTTNYSRSEIRQPDLMSNLSLIPEDIIATGKSFFAKQNIPMLGLMAGSTSSLYTQDQKLYKATRKLCVSSRKLRTFTEYGVAFGDGKWQLAGAAAIGFYGYVSEDNRLVKTSFEITEAIVSTGITIQLLKHSIGRESPGSYSRAGGKFHPFPSIH